MTIVSCDRCGRPGLMCGCCAEEARADLLLGRDGARVAMDGKMTLERAKELASILNDSARDIGERLAAGSELARHLEPLPHTWRPPLAGMGDER